MADTTASEKTSTFELRVPMMTNGKVLQPGKHQLPMSIVEDLDRRQHEYDEDQRRLLRNNGENIHANNGEDIKG